MTVRTWLYGRLTTNPSDLHDLVGDRVFAKKAMSSSIEQHPYIVYKLGNNTGLQFSEEQDASNQFIQIWVYDYSNEEVADYIRIDLVLKAVRKQLFQASSPSDGVIAVEYLETSQDLNDETLNAVMKYARYQLITKELP